VEDAAPPLSAEEAGLLKAVHIFAGLTPEEIVVVEGLAAAITYRRGQVFYTPGETGEALFLLKQGQATLYRLGTDGNKTATVSVRPGVLFGEMPFLGQRMREQHALAEQDCTLLVFTRTDVERLVATKPTVALAFFDVLAQRLYRLEDALDKAIAALKVAEAALPTDQP
jgi:CRP/FNR family transcriptional regulator